MKTLSIDLETRSSVDINKTGVYRYVQDKDFKILLFAYSVDGGEVNIIDLANGEKIPHEIFNALTDESVLKWAYNANFERVCLSRYLSDLNIHKVFLSPTSWRCTLVWAAYMGLPLSLAKVGAALNLEEQKMTEGKSLIRYFCTPPFHEPSGEKWELFKEYNKRDVEVEMSIQKRLSKFPVPDFVWQEYFLDQQINDRGILLDMELVENAIKIDENIKEKLTKELKSLTKLENPNSVMQMKAWLSERGIDTDTLDKKAVSELLKKVSPPLSTVLQIRQQLSKSSVKKYTAMKNAAGSDNRARGMFQFYGANRTGRYSGRIIQLQNLPQNHLDNLKQARELVKKGDIETLNLLYPSIPDVLSQLIRTAFIPKAGKKFIVADFSAIEARVLSWLAKEQWRMEVFANNGDIYCATASRMFHCNVVKHGENGHLRDKGKRAELACIAEGQLVLTDKGLIPIEKVTRKHRLWDGENWVNHDGVIYKGEREVITYEGLTATPDHLVWVEGQSRPVQFGIAASCGAHITQTGNGRKAIRLGENNKPRKKMECIDESLLCLNKMYGLRGNSVAANRKLKKREIKRLSKLLSTETNTALARQKIDGGKTALRESEGQGISKLRRKGNKVRVSECNICRTLSYREIRNSFSKYGIGSYRHEQELCQRESEICSKSSQSSKSQINRFVGVLSRILAILSTNCNEKVIGGTDPLGNHKRCGESRQRKKKKLAYHKRKTRLYDIRNAGRNHRFTVSGKLVHNCGYGGSVGALKAFGAIESGMKEEDLKPLVDAWREANPNIVNLWWEVDEAAKKCIKERTTAETHGLRFIYQSGMMFIELPSGRQLSYVKPRIGENKFGGESITYMGLNAAKKWERIESYGPKLVENITQATARDLLCYAMKNLSYADIVAHVHDEVIIEADMDMSLEAVCNEMSKVPSWAKGLILKADGFECEFYQKD